MSIRSKAYKVTLPAAQYSEDDARKLGDWSQDNCSRAIVVRDNDALMTWIAIRERTRTLGESLRHVRGVFHALQLDSKPLLGEHWLALCVEQEALEALAEMEEERSAAREDTIDEPASAGARHVLLPSSRRRGAGRSRPPTTTFEVERND